MRRDEIFRLVASLPPIKLCDLKIPKLQQFESEDQVEVAKLETEIKNKQEKMKTPNPDDQDILNQVQVCVPICLCIDFAVHLTM